MKRSLAHLPAHKKEELKLITSIIRETAPVEMIILFGSHARGDWVEDIYTEDQITYEYRSDFDLLVVTEDRKTARRAGLWAKVDREIRDSRVSKTWVSIIAHDIKDVNKKIERGNYFFTDIKKEGIILYDSRRYKLARHKKLNPQQRQQRAKENFKKWFISAKQFYETCMNHIERRWYVKAAFELHQATERFYHTLLLVFTGYKPKLHDLEKLGHQVSGFDKELLKIFPRATEEENRLFELLKKAYVEARYNDEYRITKKELQYLAKRVRKLQSLTRKLCKQKIESFTAVM